MAQEALLSLALPSRRAERLDVAKVDVVAERGADDPAVGGDRQHDLGFGIVPGGPGWMPASMPGADGGHRLTLGEDLGVGADADFQVLAPGALLDQRLP